MSEVQIGLLGDDEQPTAFKFDSTIIADRRKWPKDLVEIIEYVQAELKAAGVTDKELLLLTEKVLIGLSFRSGGRGFYFPNAHRVKKALLHKRIHDDWATNIPPIELVRKYRMSEPAIYRIIDEQRAIHKAHIQPALFP